MTLISILYQITDQAITDCFVRTGNVERRHQIAELIATDLTQEQRQRLSSPKICRLDTNRFKLACLQSAILDQLAEPDILDKVLAAEEANYDQELLDFHLNVDKRIAQGAESSQPKFGTKFSNSNCTPLQLAGFAANKAANSAKRKEAAAAEITAANDRQKRNEENKVKMQQRLDLKETQKQEWIAQYGSSRLKLGIELGYSQQEVYVQERAALEFPGFIVDFKNEIEIYSGEITASLAGLQKQKELETLNSSLGVSIEYVPETEQEVVMITGYLDEYYLLMNTSALS